MIVLLGAFIFFLFFNQKVSPGTTKYYNGYDTFEVENIDKDNGPTYKIKVFINSNSNPYYIYTRYSPDQVDELGFSKDSVSKVVGKKEVYLVIDPYANLTGETTIAALEIDKFLDNNYLFSMPVKSGFTKPYKNETVVDCGNANNSTAVISLTLGSETKAYTSGECLILQGKTQSDIVMLADALVFRMLSVVR